MNFPLAGGSYQGLTRKFSSERTINLFPERIESGNGKDDATAGMIGTPGLEVFAELTDGPVRALTTIPATFPDSPDRVFTVAGDSLFEVLMDGTSVLHGHVANDRLPAHFATNGNELAIASGKRLYMLKLADGTLTGPIRDSEDELITAKTVVHLDGYFLVADENNVLRFSAIKTPERPEPGLEWDALDFIPSESVPDRILALIVDHEDLLCFGSFHMQPFYNSGDADNPWAPRKGSSVQLGLVAPDALKRLDNSALFLGRDPEAGGVLAYRLNGYSPQRISNHGFEWALSKYPRSDDAWSFTFVEGGHAFWQLNFPTANASWRYDAATGLWCEVAFWDTQRGEYSEHVGRTHTAAFGKHLVGNRGTIPRLPEDPGTLRPVTFDVVNSGDGTVTNAVNDPEFSIDGDPDSFAAVTLPQIAPTLSYKELQVHDFPEPLAPIVSLTISMTLEYVVGGGAGVDAQARIYNDDDVNLLSTPLVELEPEAGGGDPHGTVTVTHTFTASEFTTLFSDSAANIWCRFAIWGSLSVDFDPAPELRIYDVSIEYEYEEEPEFEDDRDDVTKAIESPAIYRMAMDLFDDCGAVIRRERIAPHLSSENQKLTHSAMELDAEVGTSPSGVMPTVFLQVSDDGGMTWTQELGASAGTIGKYKTRLRWTRLGQAVDRVYRFVTTMKGPVRWLNAFTGIRKDGH